jgi:hypothetical protein
LHDRICSSGLRPDDCHFNIWFSIENIASVTFQPT